MKKYLKFLILLLFTIAILLDFLQRDENQYTVNNRSAKIEISNAAQKELWAFYQKAQDLSGRLSADLSADKAGEAGGKPAIDKSTATFLAVGDIMLSRNVAAKIKTADDPLLPFRPLSPLFQSVNFSFGNLESPFSGKDTFNPTGSMIFNTPRDNIKGLVKNKFKILNLANNHALDQGAAGLKYTIKYLDENGVKHIGAEMNQDEAWQPAMIDINNLKICFLGASYASINDNGKTKNDYVARIEDIDKLKAVSSKLKADCDFTVVSMHAGTEYARKPNQAQIDFARAAIDYGADIVIGHHPHWIQTIERYCPHPLLASPLKGEEKDREASQQVPSPEGGGIGRGDADCPNPKYIFYSLGNFIFDQMWSQETREGLALKMTISKQGNCHPELVSGSIKIDSGLSADKAGSTAGMTCADGLQGPRAPATLDSIELIPIIIDNYSTPRLANEEETKKILNGIGRKDSILTP